MRPLAARWGALRGGRRPKSDPMSGLPYRAQRALAPLFAAAILLGVLFFFAHRAGRRAVNDLDFKLEHPPSAAVQVVAPPPTADVELVAP